MATTRFESLAPSAPDRISIALSDYARWGETYDSPLTTDMSTPVRQLLRSSSRARAAWVWAAAPNSGAMALSSLSVRTRFRRDPCNFAETAGCLQVSGQEVVGQPGCGLDSGADPKEGALDLVGREWWWGASVTPEPAECRLSEGTSALCGRDPQPGSRRRTPCASGIEDFERPRNRPGLRTGPEDGGR